MQVRLLGMDDERLVEEVRMFPCLWDVSVKAYRDTKAKENAWKTVSNEVSALNLEGTSVSVWDVQKKSNSFVLDGKCDYRGMLEEMEEFEGPICKGIEAEEKRSRVETRVLSTLPGGPTLKS